MECDRVATWIDSYIDGELGPAEAARLDSHIGGCPRCAASVDERRRLREAIGSPQMHRSAPDSLRAAVVNMGRMGARMARSRPPRWAWVSLAASVLLAVAAGWLALDRHRIDALRTSPVHEAVSAHIRSLMATHLADIATSDRHTVKPWFAGKLDFSPTVTDHSAEGFRLVGGRLDYIGGRPAAAVVYARREHTINLFSVPDKGGKTGTLEVQNDRGFHAVHWSDGAMEYCAVSDLGTDELVAFAGLVRSDRPTGANMP
jgi:anti-sigma factor RsiW